MEQDEGGKGKGGFGPLAFGALNVPGLIEGVEMMQRAWASAARAPAQIPGLDADEIDRRLRDLRAVEQWLSMNLNMLRGTIQALEMQRDGLAAMRAMGDALSGKPGDDKAAGAAQLSSILAAIQARQMAAFAPGAAGSGGTRKPPDTGSTDGTGGDAPAGQDAALSSDSPDSRSGSSAETDPGGVAGMWWNLLQHQFDHLRQGARSVAPSSATPPKDEAKKKPARAPGKPAKRASSTASARSRKRTGPSTGDPGDGGSS